MLRLIKNLIELLPWTAKWVPASELLPAMKIYRPRNHLKIRENLEKIKNGEVPVVTTLEDLSANVTFMDYEDTPFVYDHNYMRGYLMSGDKLKEVKSPPYTFDTLRISGDKARSMASRISA